MMILRQIVTLIVFTIVARAVITLEIPTMFDQFVSPTTLTEAVKAIGGEQNALKAINVQLKYAHKLRMDKAKLEWANSPAGKAAIAQTLKQAATKTA